MENAVAIKERINSVTETKKVTDAMYMISSVKMRRAFSELSSSELYFASLKEEICKLVANLPDTDNRYFHIPPPEEGKHMQHGLLLITSDKGLAGGYNQTALNEAVRFAKRHERNRVFIIGEFGRQHFLRNKLPFVSDFKYSAAYPTIPEAQMICAELLDYFNSGELDEIQIIYTDYINGKSDVLRRSILLPLEKNTFSSEVVSGIDAGEEIEFSPDPETVLNGIIPPYLAGFIYSSLVNSFCSEQAARMEAMSTAGKNADDMLKELKTQYNSVRQAAVTREITEITAGAKALRGKRRKEQNG